MTRPSFLAAASLTLAVTAASCSSAADPAKPAEPAGSTPSTPSTPTVVVDPPTRPRSTDCEGASLALDPGAVVAKIDGEPIRASDFDPAMTQAQDKALQTYCTEIARLRQAALRGAVDDAVLARAARQKGVPVEQFVRDHLESAVDDPTDAEVEAYYEQYKKEGAPSLPAVRDQVVSAIRRDASEKAYAELVEGLTQGVTIENLMPDVRPPARDVDVPSHSPTFGPETAAVQVVEFSDFECPYCARGADAVSVLKERYGEKVRFAYRHFPLSFHQNAKPAAEYAQCAHEQGKFWEMHDAIFADQKALSRDALAASAKSVGLDSAQLQACLASGRAAKAVDEDMAAALRVGVQGTPTFYINGRAFDGGLTGEALAAAIDEELAAAKG